ncbi:jerky protein homolog-like [Mercenaria mercenaria]|uniref:jerky protein homolog-like n=1 Tax=Mercenaria mercenaria TaxID=6596 RepID=UPI00234EE984|nr:jerky protein homolog-like [Mercenaria mercenaria]
MESNSAGSMFRSKRRGISYNKPSHILKRSRQYNSETAAYKAVKERGMSVEKAARSFGVPAQTLRDRTRGPIDPYAFKSGPKTTLSMEEEETLVQHAEVMAQLGYGISNRQFQHLAGELLCSLGRKNDSKPLSNNWLYSFLSRWKDRVASLAPRKLETARAKSTTPEAVDKYFNNLGEIMNKYNLQNKPHLIYNVDETGLQPDHRPPNVIATTGSKPQAVTSPRTTTTTLIGCANAIGNSVPPFLIFKGKRFNEELLKGASPGTRAAMSDSGWSNASIFRQYLEDHFLPHIGGGGSAEEPVLLLFDGHASHISSDLIDWAKERHVVLFVLPAHTSHVLQPLDVAIFGPFKTYYYQECATFMQRNMGQSVTRYDMAKLACRAYLKAMSPVNIQAAFRKTGILPLDRGVVHQEKLFPCESFREDRPLEKVAAIKSGKDAVEEFLRLKLESSQASQAELHQCQCKKRKVSAKPKPGGRAITEDGYLEDIRTFAADKENVTPIKKSKQKPVPKKLKFPPPQSPRPSTSGMNLPAPAPIATDTDSDEEIEDDNPCCLITTP